MTAIGPAPGAESAKAKTKEWLKGVYKKELGRDLGEEGEKYWTADIHDRGQTQEQVLANIKLSPEYAAYQRGKGEGDKTLFHFLALQSMAILVQNLSLKNL